MTVDDLIDDTPETGVVDLCRDFAEGDTVLLVVPAANQDPSARDEPHRVNITRLRVRNFSFGQGAHACPAAQLARREMAIALERLVTRTTMRLVKTPAFAASGNGRIPASLLIEVTKHR